MSRFFVEYHQPTRKFYVRELEDSGNSIIYVFNNGGLCFRYMKASSSLESFLNGNLGWDTCEMAEDYAQALIQSAAAIKRTNDKYTGYKKEITAESLGGVPAPSEESEAIKEYIAKNSPRPVYLFMGQRYYPEGGMNDFIGEFISPASARDKVGVLTSDHWYQIVDKETMKVIEERYL